MIAVAGLGVDLVRPTRADERRCVVLTHRRRPSSTSTSSERVRRNDVGRTTSRRDDTDHLTTDAIARSGCMRAWVIAGVVVALLHVRRCVIEDVGGNGCVTACRQTVNAERCCRQTRPRCRSSTSSDRLVASTEVSPPETTPTTCPPPRRPSRRTHRLVGLVVVITFLNVGCAKRCRCLHAPASRTKRREPSPIDQHPTKCLVCSLSHLLPGPQVTRLNTGRYS